MADDWWEESPIIQHERAIGKVEGEVEGLRKGIVNAIAARFPHLTDLARKRVTQMNDAQKLSNLLAQLFAEPDEASVRQLLTQPAA
jgi:hypothetical protein